jgi:hypothetical protein
VIGGLGHDAGQRGRRSLRNAERKENKQTKIEKQGREILEHHPLRTKWAVSSKFVFKLF